MRRLRRKRAGGQRSTIPAEVSGFLRRDRSPSILFLGDTSGGAQRGSRDFDMSAAAAQIIAYGLQPLGLGGVRGTYQQLLRRHDHAVEAVAAFPGLLLDESGLHR